MMMIAAEKMRLDQYLVKILTDKSRSYLSQAIKNGEILVNQKKVKTGYILAVGDQIDILFNPPKELDLVPIKMDLTIVYEDEDLLVVDKPKGLVVHPVKEYFKETLVHGLLYQTKNLSAINGFYRPGIVHRIDKDTSGLLLVAKSDLAHKKLALDFKNHEIKRHYLALVHGNFESHKGIINAPIKRSQDNKVKMAVGEPGKAAITHFEVIKSFEGYSLIKCQLETGRTHQIRLHMAYIGHPVVGDPLYGRKKDNLKCGQLLHAELLGFKHPVKNNYLEFTSEIPISFKEFLNKL